MCQWYDDFCLVNSLCFCFLLALSILFSSSVSLLIESWKCAFSFISLKKLFISLSSSFLLHTFGVGIKSKFLFKSLYSLFQNENAVKLTTFSSGLDLYLIDSSIFLRNLTKFSLRLRWMKSYSVFLFFLLGLLYRRSLVRFWNFLGLFVQLDIFVDFDEYDLPVWFICTSTIIDTIFQNFATF